MDDVLYTYVIWSSSPVAVQISDKVSGKKSPRKDGTRNSNVKTRIEKKDKIRKFMQEIGFDNRRKQDKLKKALKLRGVAQTGQ